MVKLLILHQKDPSTSIPFPWLPDYDLAVLCYHSWRVSCEIFTSMESNDEQRGQSYLGLGALARKNWWKWKRCCLKWLRHYILLICHQIQIRIYALFFPKKEKKKPSQVKICKATDCNKFALCCAGCSCLLAIV